MFLDGNEPVIPSEEIDPSPYYQFCPCYIDNRGLTCESSHHKPAAPHYQVVTLDQTQNISGQDIEKYLYFTSSEYKMSRYMSLSFGHLRRNIPLWLTKLHVSNMFVPRVAKAWYDSHGWHAMPAAVNAVNNAILRANLPQKENPATYGITAINHPMEGTPSLASIGSVIMGSELIIAIFVIIGFAFIPAGCVLFLVYERSIKSKHLQLISGLHPLVYWSSNVIYDMLVYCVPALFAMAVFKFFSVEAYSSMPNFLAVICLIMAYGWCSIPMMYPATWVFREPSAAFIILAVLNIVVGISCLFVTFVLDMFTNDEEVTDLNDTLKLVCQIFPSFSLGRGLMDMVLLQVKVDISNLIVDEWTRLPGPFDFDIVGRNLLSMLILGVVFFCITILIEYGFFYKSSVAVVSKLSTNHQEDYDVSMERYKVDMPGIKEQNMVTIEHLTKIYRNTMLEKHIAVQDLCLAIPKGECFGLLGINGAGKTTTFKMLTGDLRPTAGNAYINGKSILTESSSIYKMIGYCPQFDALFDDLTGRQHLTLYATLRGITPSKIDQVVNQSIAKLDLNQYADKPSGTYSGGNKRKLSTAIALLGDPQVIFLDEPTAGMDPYAKRFLWDLILGLIEEGKSIILTSHSMEECEILCTRLSVMVSGKLRCLGSVQHLKTRFSNGYSIRITVSQKSHQTANHSKDGTIKHSQRSNLDNSSHLSSDTVIQIDNSTVLVNNDQYQHMRDNLVTTIRFMNANFPEATLKEYHFNMLEYNFQPTTYNLGRVFEVMERACKTLPVTEYSVSQNTLDNVFISFVREHKTEAVRSLQNDNNLEPLNMEELDRLASLPDGNEPSVKTSNTKRLVEIGQLKFDLDAIQEQDTNIVLSTPL